MANAAAFAIQEERQAEEEYRASLVGALDASFLLVLSLAVLADAIDVVLELLGVLVAPKLIGVMLDALTLPIGYWAAKRSGEIMNARERRDQLRQQQAQVRERRKAAHEQRTQRARAGAGAARSPVRRAWRRIVLVFFLELIPFVGIFPFWTITVVRVLRQR